MVLHRCWFNELAEIDHTTTTRAAERIKAFTSTSRDIFRPPFGKSVQVFLRSCIIVGTANRDAFLVDPSGSRRFWPIKVRQNINLALLAEWRDQIWAEAMDLFHAGVEHWLTPELEKLRAADSENFEAEDPWVAQLDLAVASLCHAGRFVSEGFTLAELMTQMGLPVHQQNRANSMKLGEILKAKGWKKFRPQVDGSRRWVWKP